MKPNAWPPGVYNERVSKDLIAMLSKGLTFGDNMNAALISFDAKHGTEAPISNPLKTVPIGFIPLGAKDSDGNDLGLERVSGLNLERTDGYLGLTAYYDPKHTEPFYERSNSIAQSIAHGAGQTVVFDTLLNSRGSEISYNAGTFTVSEAGTYEVAAKGYWESNSYTQVEFFITAGGQRSADLYLPLTFAIGPIMPVSAVFKLAAGATITATAFHTNTGPTARNLLGDASLGRATSIRIARLYNDSTPTGTVRGILVGA